MAAHAEALWLTADSSISDEDKTHEASPATTVLMFAKENEKKFWPTKSDRCLFFTTLDSNRPSRRWNRGWKRMKYSSASNHRVRGCRRYCWLPTRMLPTDQALSESSLAALYQLRSRNRCTVKMIGVGFHRPCRELTLAASYSSLHESGEIRWPM